MGDVPPLLLPTILIGIALVFWAWCLEDFRQTDEREVRTFTKQVWLVVLILGSVAGAMAWCLAGRPQRTGPR